MFLILSILCFSASAISTKDIACKPRVELVLTDTRPTSAEDHWVHVYRCTGGVPESHQNERCVALTHNTSTITLSNGNRFKPPYNHLTCAMKCACAANMKQEAANQCTGQFTCYQGYVWNNVTCTCDPIGDKWGLDCRTHKGGETCKKHIRVEVFLFCLIAELLGLLVIGFCYRGYLCAGNEFVRKMSRRVTSNASSVVTQTSVTLRQLSQRSSGPLQLSQRNSAPRYQHLSDVDPKEFQGIESAKESEKDE